MAGPVRCPCHRFAARPHSGPYDVLTNDHGWTGESCYIYLVCCFFIVLPVKMFLACRMVRCLREQAVYLEVSGRDSDASTVIPDQAWLNRLWVIRFPGQTAH